MVKPLDVTTSVNQPAAADNNVHDIFIKDILESEHDDKRKPTESGGMKLEAAAAADIAPPRKDLFHLTAIPFGAAGPDRDRVNMYGSNRTGFYESAAGTPGQDRSSTDNLFYSQRDRIKLALTSYQSPFGAKQVSYLEPTPVQLVRAEEPQDKPQERQGAPEPEDAPAPRPAPLPVKSADGKATYERTESGAWQIRDRFDRVATEHVDYPGQTIANVEPQPDGSVKITVADGKIVRERPEGGRVLYPDEDAFKANHPNEIAGKSKDIVWDGDKVKSFYGQSAKTRWHQVANDVWSTDPNAKTGWSGRIEYDGVKGTFIRVQGAGADKGERVLTRANGIGETYKTDGSMLFTIPQTNGARYSFRFNEQFADGKDVLKQPGEVKIVSKEGSETVWTKVGEKEYQTANGTKWKAEIEVTRDGTYSYKDLDTGERVVRTKDGRAETDTPANKTFTVKEDGKYTRVKVGDQELQIDYGADGKPVEYRHANLNLRLTKAADGSWTDAAIDGAQPFTKLPKFEMQMYTHEHLDPFQKLRMRDSLTKFRAMTKFSDAEKDKTFAEAERLLAGRPDSVMTAAEKANYADQLFWHVVNDSRNEQGSNGTCSMTVLRGLGLIDQPWLVARVAADMSNDGQLTVLDGSVIKPKVDSVRVRAGSPEAVFPPKSPNRSALSKLWDVVTVNISLQRDTKDPFGVTIPKGTLSYEEVAPTSRSDSGARIVKLNSDGSEYVLYRNKNGNSTPYDSPRVGYPSRIADVWHQLTGEKLTDRYLVHVNRWVDNEQTFKDLVGAKQSTEKDVETILLKNDKVKVAQGNTGILEQRNKQQQAIRDGRDPSTVARPAGGEHIFLVTGYDARTKTVSVDNSWDTSYDVPNEQEAKAAGLDPERIVFITLNDLFETLRTQTAGDGSTISWKRR